MSNPHFAEHDRFDCNNTSLESPLDLLKAVAFGNHSVSLMMLSDTRSKVDFA